ncbi:SDR family oxidoreductase [Kroppenstedtia pulmonis]|uniref:SDR family oxidoreductase n=1 Tax=Kroppenstedtia pulmonis TaxID=1380685 RepID=A0A7D4BP44_9BACL|nr:SDR family oxidoreductase [Kroppenstedtia pulmonis]QKG83731.1 SDR family oxidoreductase [Kroppenstedtia pulmonis]
MGFNEKGVALVTGSSGGLGRMSALLLAEAGWDIAIHYRNSKEQAEQLLQEVHDRGQTAYVFQGDVCDAAQARNVVNQAAKRFGRLDALVHAVGPFMRERRLFADYRPEEIDYMVDGNLKSALHTVHAALPVMRREGNGRIILFGFGRSGEAPAWPDRTAYASAKTGLVSLTKSLAVEEAPYGITVNMVCPGDIVGENKEKRIDEVRDHRDEETPLGRPGAGEDVARVIRFLCDRDSDFVTGNIIQVTGGLDVIHPVSKAKKK